MNTLQNSYKLYYLTITVFNCNNVMYSSGWLWPSTSYSVQSNRLYAIFADSRAMFVFSIFIRGFFAEPSGRKSFSFLHDSVKIVSSELNIFDLVVLLLMH